MLKDEVKKNVYEAMELSQLSELEEKKYFIFILLRCFLVRAVAKILFKKSTLYFESTKKNETKIFMENATSALSWKSDHISAKNVVITSFEVQHLSRTRSANHTC